MQRTNKTLFLALLINGVFFLIVGILLSTKTIALPRGDISPLVFYIVGGLLSGLGIGVATVDAIHTQRLQKYKRNGKKVSAVLVGFDCNTAVRILGRPPAVLVCKDASGNIYKAKFLFDYKMAFRVGESINVYVDIQNAKKYAVDLWEYLDLVSLTRIEPQ